MKLIFLAGVSFSSVLGGRTVQLARTLAPEHEIHFVEIPSLRRPRLRAAESNCDGIAVHSLPPCLGRNWFGGVARYLKKQIGVTNATALVSNPFWQPLLEELPELKFAYDCLDYIAIHCPGSEQKLTDYVQRENWLIKNAKHVFAVSPRLAEMIAEPEKCVLLPNAVPESWLQIPLFKTIEPVIGFHGALYEWLDYELLEQIADAFPECKLRLAGPVRQKNTVSALRRKANVELLPERSFDQLPELIHSFRVGIIPFRSDEVSKCADPLKTYEYLSLGKPVLTTVPPENGNPYIKYAPPESFIHELRELLSHCPAEDVCRGSVSHDTWRDRAELLVSTINRGTTHA